MTRIDEIEARLKANITYLCTKCFWSGDDIDAWPNGNKFCKQCGYAVGEIPRYSEQTKFNLRYLLNLTAVLMKEHEAAKPAVHYFQTLRSSSVSLKRIPEWDNFIDIHDAVTKLLE